MRLFTDVKKEYDGKYWVEIGLCDAPATKHHNTSNYKELGSASVGNTKATALRNAARALEAEAKRLRKQAAKL